MSTDRHLERQRAFYAHRDHAHLQVQDDDRYASKLRRRKSRESTGTEMQRRDYMIALGLVALAFLLYGRTLGFDFVSWDDPDYVTRNETLRSWSGLGRIWFEPTATPQYYPLTFSALWLEYQLWGLHPAGYHLVSILLHAATAVAVWRVLRRLALPGAWLAAAIFALHPVHVETVAWITERKNTLSGLLYVLALLAWLRYRPRDGGN